MAKSLQRRTSDIEEGIIILYSDINFYWETLHGRAYKYWWEIMTRTPDYRVFSTVELFRAGELRR